MDIENQKGNCLGRIMEEIFSEIFINYAIYQTQYFQWKEVFLQGGQTALSTRIGSKRTRTRKGIRRS